MFCPIVTDVLGCWDVLKQLTASWFIEISFLVHKSDRLNDNNDDNEGDDLYPHFASLITSDGIVHHLHKLLMSVASPVFAELVNHRDVDDTDGRVIIRDAVARFDPCHIRILMLPVDAPINSQK